MVDDDEFDRDACRRVLEDLSWEVVDAATPEEAIRHLDEGRLDAIVSDFDLKAPKHGVDVLAHALQVRPTAARILMSGLLPPGVLEPAQRRGEVQHFVQKPDVLDEWHAIFQNVLPQVAIVGTDGSRTAAQARSEGTQQRYGSLEERVRWLSLVVDLGAAAHSGESLRATFDRAVKMVSETLEMEYVKILRLLPGGKEVLLEAGVGWKPGLVGKARVSTGMDSQAGYTLASDHPVIAEDLRAETRFSGPALLHEHGVVSGLSVTIPGEDGTPWGVFGAHTKKHRRLSQDHALFLSAVANVVAGAIARDRTEETLRSTQDVLEREVRERTRALEVAVEDLQAFNAMVAHDLRAPLRVATQSLGMFLRDHGQDLTPQALKLLRTTERATGQMRDLVEDLLAFAKATQDPLTMADVDVTAMARERWEVITEQEPEREVAFHVEEGLTAHADPRLLDIVLDNMLGNAFKFTRYEKEARVDMVARHLEVGGTAFCIRDNGAGFPPEQADRLYHPFRRLHAASEFEGTGIGLATVRRIIERHQGSTWAESEGPGKGASFCFRLLPAGLP